MTSLDEEIALAERLARKAGTVILPHFRAPGQIQIKNKASGDGNFDPVTQADHSAEAAIRELLVAMRPHDGVEGEEMAARPSRSGRHWVIDPIDGTRAFIAGLPLWGVLIALNDGARPIVGVGYQPWLDELFVGSAQGSRLNGQPLKTRDCRSLAQARLATTDTALFSSAAEQAAFEALSARAQFRRLGLDWYAYAMLAAGHIDLVVESGLKAHDVQALIPLVEGAGGLFTDWRGGDAQAGGQVVAAATAALLEQALAILKPAAA
ncbi:MAG: histidinol-phosphatase [Alphaproteobacteria bacterium]|nr:MAG: histidinol-phosphatase [Alphaproteobacteria bacterium]